jgi:hypothetical protein
VCAAAAVTEKKTGIAFPASLRVSGVERTCVGAGLRAKALLGPIAVSVYAVALYLDASSGVAAEALLSSSSTAAQTLFITFARTVTPEQFIAALSEQLAPVLGKDAALDAFSAFIRTQQLEKGSSVLLSRLPEGTVEVCVLPPGAAAAPATAGARFESPAFARALFDVYLGPASIVPDARAAWLAGTREVLARS